MPIRQTPLCLSYRHDIISRGHNTNNFCEASIRIFKDVILQRCKVFNMCALLDFITDTFDNYHKKRLLQFANGRELKLTVNYEKFCQKSKSITEISPLDDTSYLIKEKTDVYVVDSVMGTCDCLSGKGGRYCKHVCAVELKFGLTVTASLNLTEDCRQNLRNWHWETSIFIMVWREAYHDALVCFTGLRSQTDDRYHLRETFRKCTEGLLGKDSGSKCKNHRSESSIML